MKMEDEIIYGKTPWNVASDYTLTLGRAVSNANRYSQMLIRPRIKERETLFIDYFRELRFVVMEMLLSPRFKKETNTLKKILGHLDSMRVSYSNENYRNLDMIYLRISDIITKYNLIEYEPSTTTPEGSALTMMK